MQTIDIHTHNSEAAWPAVISVPPGTEHAPGRRYSVGIHPWDSAEPGVETALERLRLEAAMPEVVAIGETGIDKRRGASLERQEWLMHQHVEMSESAGKPLIIHAVGSFTEIIRLKNLLRPGQPWIIHGFRGKPQLAAELLSHGFYLSLGERFNPESAALIPADRLLVETDESKLPIEEIAARFTQLDPSLPMRLLNF